MCLILIAIDQHPEYPVLIAANRDELYSRPTLSMHYWDDHPMILAGRDQEKGGTWFGINKNGRFAAVTNTRSERAKTSSLSRGSLVNQFLLQNETSISYLNKLRVRINDYDGFNLVVGEGDDIFAMGTHHPEPLKIGAGYHGISNGELKDEWPRVVRGKRILQEIIEEEDRMDVDRLFKLLLDRHCPEDELLPQTCHDSVDKRLIAPIFIQGDTYGTRSSTLLLKHKDAGIQLMEKSFNNKGEETGSLSFRNP